jgi:hypothetical protein
MFVRLRSDSVARTSTCRHGRTCHVTTSAAMAKTRADYDGLAIYDGIPSSRSARVYAGTVNIGLPLAVADAGTSSCITSQCSTSFPSRTRKMSTATSGFSAQPT